MRTVDFEYDIQETVKIPAIGMTGRIDAVMLADAGQEFRVVYWNNGSRCSVWMYGWEIEPVNAQAGFHQPDRATKNKR
jgi:hypothetical protein